ncbi:MAG: hypothetical protein ACOC5T_04225 [Elusimicrobiota bacterium]
MILKINMTHIIGAFEGYWEYVQKLLDYFHSKENANRKAKIRAFFPVNFIINQEKNNIHKVVTTL